MNWKNISLVLLLTISPVKADVFDLWEQGVRVDISEDAQELFDKHFQGKSLKFLDKRVKAEGSTLARFYDTHNPGFNGWVFVDHTDTKIEWFGFTTTPSPDFNTTDKGQLADVLTTGAGLAAGLVEANPIPVPLLLPSKLLINEVVKKQNFEDCFSNLAGLSVTGYAAAGWNLGMLAFGGPVAIIPAVALAYATFPDVSSRLWSCAEY
jgi:hypothetical protein